MNKYKQTFTMFHGNLVSDFLAHNTNRIQYEIGETQEDYILNVNEEAYLNYLAQEFTIDTPHIDFEQMSVDSYEDEIPAEYFPSSFVVDRDKSYRKQVVVYHLPYTGNPELFKYTPSTHQLSFPEVYLEGQGVCFDIINFSNNPDEIKRGCHPESCVTIHTVHSKLSGDQRTGNQCKQDADGLQAPHLFSEDESG